MLVERGLVSSRQRAQAMILAGQVLVDDQPVDKVGSQVAVSAAIRLRGEDMPFVSRGGLKLAGGLDEFALQVAGRVAIDVGASTGGFTDCLLQRGARRVYAIDVGYGQLAWKLRQDERVVNLERTNIRDLAPGSLAERPDLAVIDASFISLEKVLPPTLALLTPDAQLIALVKPQFEVGRGKVGKGGVVRDPLLHEEVIVNISRFAQTQGCRVEGVCPSPILGPKGNREFFVFLQKTASIPQNHSEQETNHAH